MVNGDLKLKPDLSSPPSTDVGQVAAVHMNHSELLAGPQHTQPCQVCGEPVRWVDEHVLAMLEVYGAKYGLRRLRFCGPGCWSRWAVEAQTDDRIATKNCKRSRTRPR